MGARVSDSTTDDVAQADRPAVSDLALRVRAWRARRGMTRKALAADSGLSERFLADVEGGRGNPSVQSLQALATALNITLPDLFQDPPRPALARLQALMAGLDEARAHAVLALVEQHLGLAPAPGRERRIALLGLRGAGKSTLGQQLATSRGLPFVELDRETEREAGTSMNEILLLHGQAGYRRYERRALLRIAGEQADGVVLTTGGSIVSERDTFELLQQHFYCVWLKASPQEHMARVVAQGDMRPFDSTRGASAEALADIHRILASREALYARADAVVDTAARSVRQSLQDLERAVPVGR